MENNICRVQQQIVLQRTLSMNDNFTSLLRQCLHAFPLIFKRAFYLMILISPTKINKWGYDLLFTKTYNYNYTYKFRWLILQGVKEQITSSKREKEDCLGWLTCDGPRKKEKNQCVFSQLVLKYNLKFLYFKILFFIKKRRKKKKNCVLTKSKDIYCLISEVIAFC